MNTAADPRSASGRGDPMISRIIADRYRLEARAGEGGIGAVYRARHLIIDRVVAIKILQPVRRGETHHRDWFLREAKAANRINHANIVDIYDFGDTEDGLYYLVMEYLEGEPLSHVIARGPMPINRAADVLEQTTAAMARAHDLGVVHRDIKSDNIFLIERGGRHDFVKVFDFGLAALARDARLAPAGAVFGTPEYMSPEQSRGEDATPASDLYALGIVFFEMLTGRLPFVTANRQDLLKMHQEAPPPSPRALNPEIPQEAERVILRLLEKDPAARYRDAHHLLEDVKALQRSAPRDLAWNPLPAVGPLPAKGKAPVTSGVAVWALRSVMFGRMVARVAPQVASAPHVARALEDMWRLSVSAARVEASISQESGRVEAYERRARDLRAQLGRQVEELAGEESRLKRSLADAQSAASTLRADRDESSSMLDSAWAEIARLEAEGDDNKLRSAYEKAGEARARFSSRAYELARLDARIARMNASISAIASRIMELRESLHTQADSIDNALGEVRRRMAERGRDRAQILRDLERSAMALSAELEFLPECQELFEEMELLVGPLPVTTQSNAQIEVVEEPPSESRTLISSLAPAPEELAAAAEPVVAAAPAASAAEQKPSEEAPAPEASLPEPV